MAIDKESGSAPTGEVVSWGLHSLCVSSHDTITCKHDHCDQDDDTIKSKYVTGAASGGAGLLIDPG